jgi:hypothetical protein
VLAPFQRQLERIYEVEIPHSVDDFLITDREVLRDIQGDEATGEPEVDEQLLVVQDGDHLDISLYISDEVMNRLADDDPESRLHEGNIADFCTAMEGVSHFVYLIWNASYERAVSLMELEMQAEIDKYVSTAFLFGQQDSGRIPPSLHSWLFEQPDYDSSLDQDSLERYRDANYYAGRYCSRLERRYLRGNGQAGIFNDLRRLYRLTNNAKRCCAVEES